MQRISHVSSGEGRKSDSFCTNRAAVSKRSSDDADMLQPVVNPSY